MIKLVISEEYGYRYWLAELTQDEYDLLIDRWESMRGLNCLVPVTLIIPQAKPLDSLSFDWEQPGARSCHIHQWDDSHLEGTDYRIPNDKHFWMDGMCFEDGDYGNPETN
jgi:hypothetical protein